jgi:hypothetical protein
MFQRMTVDEYLQILHSASPTDHPFTSREDGEVLGAAFVPLAHAMANFVEVIRVSSIEGGYPAARGFLEDMVHSFPAEVEPDETDPLAALLAILNRGATGTVQTEDLF